MEQHLDIIRDGCALYSLLKFGGFTTNSYKIPTVVGDIMTIVGACFSIDRLRKRGVLSHMKYQVVMWLVVVVVFDRRVRKLVKERFGGWKEVGRMVGRMFEREKGELLIEGGKKEMKRVGNENNNTIVSKNNSKNDGGEVVERPSTALLSPLILRRAR